MKNSAIFIVLILLAFPAFGECVRMNDPKLKGVCFTEKEVWEIGVANTQKFKDAMAKVEEKAAEQRKAQVAPAPPAQPGAAGLRLEDFSNLSPQDTAESIEQRTGVKLDLQKGKGAFYSALVKGQKNTKVFISEALRAETLILNFCGSKKELCLVIFRGDVIFHSAMDYISRRQTGFTAVEIKKNVESGRFCNGISVTDRSSYFTAIHLARSKDFKNVARAFAQKAKKRAAELEQKLAKLNKMKKQGLKISGLEVIKNMADNLKDPLKNCGS